MKVVSAGLGLGFEYGLEYGLRLVLRSAMRMFIAGRAIIGSMNMAVRVRVQGRDSKRFGTRLTNQMSSPWWQ